MRTSESITKIAAALLKAQRKMGSASKGSVNPYFKSRYADLGSVMEVVKEPLNEEGISLLQPTYSKDGVHYVESILMHESGEFIASEPLKLEVTKVDMQALGSSISYARRYSLQSLLSIPAEDDDGEKTMSRPAKKTESVTIVGESSITAVSSPQISPNISLGTVSIVSPLVVKPSSGGFGRFKSNGTV